MGVGQRFQCFFNDIFASQVCDTSLLTLGSCVAFELFCVANCDAIPAIADLDHIPFEIYKLLLLYCHKGEQEYLG